MGRTPRINARGGRDHWTHCMSVLLAGGGIRGGQTYGTSDRVGGYPDDKAVTPAHISKTIYHAMGIHNLEAVDADGLPFHLLEDGFPLTELF